VLGITIDLDEKKVEFFSNGSSLGPAFSNVSVGENVAYFPAISFSKNETVCYNFGNSPLIHNYPGFEPLDIPEAIVNGSLDITVEFVEVLKNNLLKILTIQNTSSTNKYIC